MVTTELLGKAKFPNLTYAQPNDTPYKIDTDYFGKKRSKSNPTADPFASPGGGHLRLKVWPRNR